MGFSFFYTEDGLDGQPTTEAHSPSLHVYTTAQCWLKIRTKKRKKTKNKRTLQVSKYLLLTTFIAGMVPWRLAPVCLFHLVWFSNLLEAQRYCESINDRGGLTELNISISNRGYYTLYVVYLNWKTLKTFLIKSFANFCCVVSGVSHCSFHFLATWGQ